MRIGLIAMSGVRVRSPELAALGVTLPGFVRRGKVIASLPSLGLLTVAALTPASHELAYIEIQDFSSLNREQEFDLVGISSMTAQINEAYRVADHFRQRGTRVVMGGLHVSQLPEEALEHADAAVVNGAEGVWPQVLADAERGRLQRIYHGADDELFSPTRYVRPRFDLLRGREYNRVTIQTSRGCPRGCEFCGASLRIVRRFNQKPVARVLEEIREARRHVPSPFFEFADDNTFLNRDWSKQLLRALAFEGIQYFTETDASIADDPELCDLLAESGCKQVLIGFESPQPEDLTGVDPGDWKKRQAPNCERVIDALQSRGVSVNGCFIVGLDNHTPEVFPSILDFVRRSGLAEVQFTVLTPFPGTPLYQRLKREGRLLHEHFWDRCTLFDVNYRPKKMSVTELEEGLQWLFREAYNRQESGKRLRGFARQRQAGRPRFIPE
jgi:radical SAM superfamily enzyme YgiQ (UPF0313 family)